MTPLMIYHLGVVLALVAVPAAAWAHWTIVSQLTAPAPGRTFDLRLHYEVLAGQANPDKAQATGEVAAWQR